MPLLTWDELANDVAESIDGMTSLVIWQQDEADEWASVNEYESYDDAIDDGMVETPRWRFVIAPISAANPGEGWELVDEHFGYPDSDSGFSYNGNAPAFEGVIYPEPGQSYSAAEIIDEAMSEGVSNYGPGVPDQPAY